MSMSPSAWPISLSARGGRVGERRRDGTVTELRRREEKSKGAALARAALSFNQLVEDDGKNRVFSLSLCLFDSSRKRKRRDAALKREACRAPREEGGAKENAKDRRGRRSPSRFREEKEGKNFADVFRGRLFPLFA